MYVNTIQVRNFRILSDSKLDFKDNLCLLIGKNNSGKTSFLVLFEKFIKKSSFDFNDFSLRIRKEILNIHEETIENDLAIQLILIINYDEKDNLSHLSEFIMDLDSNRNDVKILFECSINKQKLLEDLENLKNVQKDKYIQKHLNEYLETNIYAFNNDEDLEKQNRHRLVKKDFKDIDKLIDFEIIHAKRKVSSSEEKNGKKVLSSLTTNYFNNNTINETGKFEKINKVIDDMDKSLNESYGEFFGDFLSGAKDFLALDNINIISNLKAKEIVSDSSELVYGKNNEELPEYQNGLGHMNILYLLLDMEIKKNKFAVNKKDIQLLFIEEPEAHTHPQLQYIFARKVSEIIENMTGVQAIITTHSPHIVANHPFQNIRYMLIKKDENDYKNIQIKNFYEDLSTLYENENKNREFKFLQQYLTIESAELFFADKVLFIEGVSENMLMPYFIDKFDKQKIIDEKELQSNPETKTAYVPLASQNITTIQMGSNAVVFKHFLEFLSIPTLIITDIDTTKGENTEKGIKYKACSVEDSPENTSNQTIKYYYKAPDIKKKKDFKIWLNNLLTNRLEINEHILVAYQISENDYHARSFEDAFINANLEIIKTHRNDIGGLKKLDEFDSDENIYTLTKSIIDKKSDFASSILFLALITEVNWNIPEYISGGLEWLQQK